MNMFDSVKRIISPLHPLVFIPAPNKGGFEGKVVTEVKSPSPKAPPPSVPDNDIVISFDFNNPLSTSFPRAFIEHPTTGIPFFQFS